MQFSTYTFIGSALLAASMVAAQGSDGLVVSTLPLITTCAVNRLTWTGGVAPFLVKIIVPGQASQVLQTLDSTNNNYYLYTPDGKTTGIEPNDTVAVFVSDGMGVQTASAGIPIIAGVCSGASSSSSAAPSSASSASTASSSTSSAAPVTTMTTTTTRASTSTTTTAAATSSSAAPTGAAAPALNGLTAVIAGAVGVVAAALI